MKIRIGKIELEEWIVHSSRTNYFVRPYRYLLDKELHVTCIYIDYKIIEDGTRIYFPDFTGRFKGPEFNFLEKAYQYQEFASYEEAQEYVDKFLIRMNKLLAFA